MIYTTQQLKHLRNIRAKGFDDYHDSGETNEREDFIYNTERFIDWIEKMEREGKMVYLLSQMQKH